MPSAETDRALIPSGDSGNREIQVLPGYGVLDKDRVLAERQIQREAHFHSQIWTKDAHDGPYRKATITTGYDIMLEEPDRRKKKPEPGYEQPESGPTTNFVGNHMTQGAIDLVQAELTALDAVHELRRIEYHESHFQPPRLLSRTPAAHTLPSPASTTAAPEGAAKSSGQQNRSAPVADSPVAVGSHSTAVAPAPSSGKALGASSSNSGFFGALGDGQQPVPLADLRRAIRAFHGHKKPGDGRLLAPIEPMAALEAPQARNTLELEAGPPPDNCTVQDLSKDAHSAACIGNHAEAVKLYTWALARSGASSGSIDGNTPVPGSAGLFSQRAVCLAELGRFRLAVQDYTEALAAGGSEHAGTAKLLIERTKAKESLELYTEALNDLKDAMAADPSNKMVSAAMARVMQEAAAQAKENKRKPKQAVAAEIRPSPPHPGMPCFEYRGKSGKPF